MNKVMLIIPLLLLKSYANFESQIKTRTKGFEYINHLRIAAGMTKFSQNRYLMSSALNHALYCKLNNKISHKEKKTHSRFTGNNASERATYAGYKSKLIGENISFSGDDIYGSIDNLFSAIYHRFGFLSFYYDEIGLGSTSSNTGNIFVYNMGSSRLNKLCGEKENTKGERIIVSRICNNDSFLVGKIDYLQTKNKIVDMNKDYVLFPFDGQKNVMTSFFEETPDPTPECKINGYPVSIQLNPLTDEDIIEYNFRLYTASQNKEVTIDRVIDKNTDPNKRFNEKQFALFPSEPLSFGTEYKAIFSYKTQKQEDSIEWKFMTKTPDYDWYQVSQTEDTISISSKKEYIFYFKPDNCNDVIGNYTIKSDMIDITNVRHKLFDQNTLYIKIDEHVQHRATILIETNNEKKLVLKVLP